jgi:hypothetical protein
VGERVAQGRFRRERLDEFAQRGRGGGAYRTVGVGERRCQRRTGADGSGLGEHSDGRSPDGGLGVGQVGPDGVEFGLLLGEGEEFEEPG